MICAIHQPNYVPWLGYFYKIYKSDVFIFLDNVQFTKNSFQNRNRLKTPQGPAWLTQPVLIKGKYGQLTKEVEFNNRFAWKKKHLKTLEVNYKKSKYFHEYFPKLEEKYVKNEWKRLVDFNTELIKLICNEIGLSRQFEISSDLEVSGKATQLLVDICQSVRADTYLSGGGGGKYQDENIFKNKGIKVIYSDFSHPIYPQLWGEFEPNLSILDLLFNCGPESLTVLCSGDESLIKDAG